MLTGSGCPLRRYLVAGTSFKKPVGSAHMQRSLNLCSKGVPRQTRADPTSATGFLVMPCRRRANRRIWGEKDGLANTREAGLAQALSQCATSPPRRVTLGIMCDNQANNFKAHSLCDSGESGKRLGCPLHGSSRVLVRLSVCKDKPCLSLLIVQRATEGL